MNVTTIYIQPVEHKFAMKLLYVLLIDSKMRVYVRQKWTNYILEIASNKGITLFILFSVCLYINFVFVNVFFL